MPVGKSIGLEALANISFSLKTNPDIKKVIFNDPATIVYWSDNTRTVVKCQDGDTYSKEQGLAMCIAKKYFGNKGNFNEVFKKFIGDEYTHGEEEIDENTMYDKLRAHCKRHICDNCVLHKPTLGRPGCYNEVSSEMLREHYNIVFGK